METLHSDALFYLINYPSLVSESLGFNCNEHESMGQCVRNGSINPCMGYNKPALSTSFILKKLMIAHFTIVLSFLDHQVSSMGSRGWSTGQHNQESIEEFQQVKRDWLRFRSAPIRRNLDLIFDAFAISRSGSDVSRGWSDWQYEFRWLKMRLSACSGEYQAITGDIAALSNIVTSNKAVEESQRAAEEAKRTTEISVYAFVLIPLSFMAGLFGMSDEYLPGGTKFWIFWAVAIPFDLFTLALLWLTRKFLAKKFTLREMRHWPKAISKGSKMPHSDEEIELADVVSKLSKPPSYSSM
jgi:hypothetical protein